MGQFTLIKYSTTYSDIQSVGHKMMWKFIEKYLQEKKISIYKLSKLSGIPDNTLRNYRSKKSDPSFTNACKITDALDISLDEIRKKMTSK